MSAAKPTRSGRLRRRRCEYDYLSFVICFTRDACCRTRQCRCTLTRFYRMSIPIRKMFFVCIRHKLMGLKHLPITRHYSTKQTCVCSFGLRRKYVCEIDLDERARAWYKTPPTRFLRPNNNPNFVPTVYIVPYSYGESCVTYIYNRVYSRTNSQSKHVTVVSPTAAARADLWTRTWHVVDFLIFP